MQPPRVTHPSSPQRVVLQLWPASACLLQVRRAEGLEARLADAHAQLRGASAASDERARGLEAQHAAAQAAWLAHGEEQRQRQGQADAFLQERDAWNARIELLTSQLEDQGQQSQQQHLVSAGYASGAVLGSLGPW